jgi:hypothetical protein
MRPFTLTFLVALAPVVAIAQVDSATAAVPKPGAEVRITTRVGRTFYGHLDGISADSVRIRTPGANDGIVVAAIPRDSIMHFEVNHRGAPHTAAGALLGLAGGALVGAMIASANCLTWCTQQEQDQSNKDVELGLLAGGVIGALSGTGIRSSHWSEVAAARVRVTARPAGGGLGVGLTLRF